MTDTRAISQTVNYWYSNSGTAPTTPTVPFHLRLMTALGSGNGNVNGSNGTEATSGNCPGYTAGGNTLGANPTFTTMSESSPAAISNENAVSWSATGSWSTIVGVEIWDTAGTPVRWMQGAVTSNITGVSNGDTVNFAIGSITADPTAW
jgi:hypothetical protein